MFIQVYNNKIYIPYKAMRAVLSVFLIADDNLYIFTKNNAVWSDFMF